MFTQFEETLTFDDVLLVPMKSAVLPKETEISTRLTKKISLKIPLLSSPMDTVTECKMAIALALQGGIGIIHKNLTPENQAKEVTYVKRFENGFIENPVTLQPEDKISEVAEIKNTKGYKKIPIVDGKNKLVGLITELDYFLPEDEKLPVKFRMKPIEKTVVGRQGITLKRANIIIRDNNLSVLPIVDKTGRLVSMVTRSDLEKNELYPNACKDEKKQLRVGAAIAVGNEALERARLLTGAGADVLVIDTAHGHSQGVLDTLRALKKDRLFSKIEIIVGNVATEEGTRDLIRAGADAIKVGVGSGSICTTRIIAGVGVPQISAIKAAVKGRGKNNVPIISDGGVRYSGDIVKALAAGADSVMIGGLFAGCDETPGRVEYEGGRMYKSYRGMGSLEAMTHGSKDRYGQADQKDATKLVPEGITGKVLYKGHLADYVYQIIGGLRSGMGYLGAATIKELQQKAHFIKISNAGLKESHPHDISIVKHPPNYPVD
ncbi:MAG: IMP dehydrogenase [Candidatus Kerfeldbacteria bacterium CG_4_10_14_0_8_um_filter_42_10]|uniref:Inosine-5'-monophosphate dehydrogenase n=1 Tax=Candidatus Kerfeldbacteria bacterium CG_4_10_14_0_8_um_filter_42_10 TaxID=2014248 RepID=A0A2M7RJ72_9BACT|nr:MAG: IMP dehydrogenase [Candidatus Kerfeldbacteria bacterium CG_4_10_14_0_8_um_filter_42_10]